MNIPIKLALSTISVGGITVGAGFSIHYLTKKSNTENIKIIGIRKGDSIN